MSFRPLQDLLLKKSEANILLAALDLKIFTVLVSSHSAEEISENLNLHPQNTHHFLNALASCDLISKNKDGYWNSPLANEFLVAGKETYLGEYLRSSNPFYDIPPEKICILVREGPSPSIIQSEMRTDEFWKNQNRGTINYQRSGIAQIVVKIIASLPEYAGFSRMLDLGCGPGLIGIALILDHPIMNGVLFDLPVVARCAKKCVTEYNVSDRLTVISGDYLIDSIGEGYDLVLASMTLNYALGSFDILMNKIYTALNPGGVFVTISEGIQEKGTKPEDMVISMLLPELLGENMIIAEDFIANALLKAGFSSVRTKSIPTPVGDFSCDIGRKKRN